MKQKITAVFDIGKTNKKLLLFDGNYRVIEEHVEKWDEIIDEDGFACDDLLKLTNWIKSSWAALKNNQKFEIEAVNVAAYGASFVHLDANNSTVTPLYSYLKPFPKDLEAKLYETYGSAEKFTLETCSPTLGMLNSGLQLLWLKHVHPQAFRKIHTSLHLPQYIAFLLSENLFSDYTSVGCHTALWNFEAKKYHQWVYDEHIDHKLAPFTDSTSIVKDGIKYGFGLHDSSSVVMAYLRQCKGQFMILSTGTWCIVLNPFSDKPLASNELKQDVLSFLTAEGNPIKAARMFLGREHDHQVEQLAAHFNVDTNYFKKIQYNPIILEQIIDQPKAIQFECMNGTGPFPTAKNTQQPTDYHPTAELAYHQLLLDLVSILSVSFGLVSTDDAKTIYIDGGFARNQLFVQLLANLLPQKNIVVSEVPQATALGAAMWVNQNETLASDWTFRPVDADALSNKVCTYSAQYIADYGKF